MEENAISEFVSITQTTDDLASKYLEVCKWDVPSAVERFFENPNLFGGAAAIASSNSSPREIQMSDEEEEFVREPMKKIKTRLVVDDLPSGRGTRRTGTQQPTEAFRNLREEQSLQFGANKSNKKSLGLADLYKPPLELIFKGNIEKAKLRAVQDLKYLLINIQDPAVFDCQLLNRDTWSDIDIKSLISSSFVMLQLYDKTDLATEYTTWYQTTKMPHIAVLDPKTGERLWYYEGMIDPKSLRRELKKLLEEHPYEIDGPIFHNTTNGGKVSKDLLELSEEEQLALVIANSLRDNLDANTENTDQESRDNKRTSSSMSKNLDSSDDEISHLGPDLKRPKLVENIAFESQTRETEPPKTPASEELEDSVPEELLDCTLQIRLPEGSSLTQKFYSESKLSVVSKFISRKLAPNTSFVISTPYPRRVFSVDDLDTITLKQASLFPRAVIVVEKL